MSKTACTKPRVGLHTHNNSTAMTIPVEARELEDSKNEGDRAKPHCVYHSGRNTEQAVTAPGQLMTASTLKVRRTGQQEPMSFVPSAVPTTTVILQKPTVK